MKLPGPDHPITIEPLAGRVVVRVGGEAIVDTRRALVLREASLPPVYYVPREDARMELLERTTHSTHCPYKGDASYFTVRACGRLAQNAAWSYETPFPAMAEIAGRLAFYPSRVDAIERSDD